MSSAAESIPDFKDTHRLAFRTRWKSPSAKPKPVGIFTASNRRPHRLPFAFAYAALLGPFGEDQQQRAGDVDRAIRPDHHADHHDEREQVNAFAAEDV